MNVVTLLPSATEIVSALGAEPVAVSHSCDYPPEVREKPAITYSRVDADADSATIDEQVLEADRGGGVYGISTEQLERVDPDLIITQGICDVCAVDTVLVREAVEKRDLDCEIITTDPHRLEDVFADIERIGQALGREERAADLLDDLRARVEQVRVAGDPDDRYRTLDIDWMDPVMIGGHWVPELIEIIGGEYGLIEAGEASTPVEWTSVVEYDPERLVIAPCGFEIGQTMGNIDELRDRDGWDDLTAVREGRIFVVDGSAYLNRPSHRLVDSLELLAGLFHPAFETPDEGAARSLSARSLRA